MTLHLALVWMLPVILQDLGAGHCSSLENEGGLGQVCVFLPNAPSKEQGDVKTVSDNVAKDFLFPPPPPENVILNHSHFNMDDTM